MIVDALQHISPTIDTTKKTRVVDLWQCDPIDDRCVRPTSPTFRPGISVRHSPSCTGQICNLWACDGGNWRVTNRNTLDRSEWIKGWAMTQLLTRGYVDCDQHPLGQRGGGWWADVFRQGISATQRGTGFRSGSKLWAILFRHAGATSEALLQARAYAQEALAYLISWGIASNIYIDAFYIAQGPLMGRRDRKDPMGAAIQLRITIHGPGVSSEFTLAGRQQPNSMWLWDEYRGPSAIAPIPGRHYQAVW